MAYFLFVIVSFRFSLYDKLWQVQLAADNSASASGLLKTVSFSKPPSRTLPAGVSSIRTSGSLMNVADATYAPHSPSQSSHSPAGMSTATSCNASDSENESENESSYVVGDGEEFVSDKLKTH